MKTTCIINNYNYGKFLEEAIKSCKNQTRKFDEIIIVDDGSTDHSSQIAKQYVDDHLNIKFIEKTNGGQLSCFDIGFQKSIGDVIFFLDADDLYETNYLETALIFYEKHPSCDFLFCGLKEFDLSNKIRRTGKRDIDFGYTRLLTSIARRYIGAPTSAVSIKRSLLTKILPLPLWSDWITRADDCLIIGASLSGGRKMYMDKVLIKYRVHGNNFYTGRNFAPEQEYKYIFALDKMYRYFITKFQLTDASGNYLYLEFQVLSNPTFRQFKHYIKAAITANIKWSEKRSNISKILRYYLYLKMNLKRS